MKGKKNSPVGNKEMMSIEETIWRSQNYITFAKQAVILMLRESQGLTRPISLKLGTALAECRAAAHSFVGFWYNENPITINDLLEKVNSPMFFCVRGGREMTIFLGNQEEALKTPVPFAAIETIQLENRFATEK
jgi:hypothetical protein